ncbi:putative AP-1 complex subunit sigma-1-like [Capsicum annuum]
MPNPYPDLFGNLLGANWSSSCLNQIFLLTNSFRNTFTKLPLCDQNLLETILRLCSIREFTTEIDIKTSSDQMYANLFSEFAWHFFDVVPNDDIDKPGCYWLEMQRYLEIGFLYGMLKNKTSESFAQILGCNCGPRHFRCNSVPLPPGRYRGEIDVEDNVIAGLEDLRLGLVRCKEGKQNVQNLIVESDNVMLVQYVIGRPEPNAITMYRLKEISDLLKHRTCAFLYIYKEANEAARDWALRDECPNKGPNAASERKLYVGNLHLNMTQLQLRQIFEAFGPVEHVNLPTDPETGHSKGFGFVQFAQLEHAKAAQSLNGKLEIGGCTIKVSSFTEHVGVQDAGVKTADFDDDAGDSANVNLNLINMNDYMESNVDFHIKDEAERLLKEIELMMKNVENSEFYAGIRLDLKQNATIQKHLFRLLGSHSHVQVVICALGSIEYSFSSQFHLALVLLLKRDFSNWIGNVEIYNPVMSPADIIVFKELGPEVLTIDENFLCCSIDTGYLGIDFIYRMLKNESSERFAQILGHTRGPRHLRCISVPLPPGWIKLNIYGVGTKGNQLGQFSGVFRDENGMGLSRYRGEIDVEDNAIAGLEALRLGLVRCKEGKPNARKLLVESDNVMLVQYVNGRPEPNPITMYRLKEIFDLLKHITCAFLYIYEEANEAARDWVLRDECHNKGPKAASERTLCRKSSF